MIGLGYARGSHPQKDSLIHRSIRFCAFAAIRQAPNRCRQVQGRREQEWVEPGRYPYRHSPSRRRRSRRPSRHHRSRRPSRRRQDHRPSRRHQDHHPSRRHPSRRPSRHQNHNPSHRQSHSPNRHHRSHRPSRFCRRHSDSRDRPGRSQRDALRANRATLQERSSNPPNRLWPRRQRVIRVETPLYVMW